MSAETLRRAAALMRERAEGADGTTWSVSKQAPEMLPDVFADRAGESCEGCGAVATMVSDENAAHIASWHPAVALAVADWLDDAATLADETGRIDRHALAVARAYLGDAS